MTASRDSNMTSEQATRTIDDDVLAQIERSLRYRLRAHHVSDAFVDRNLEDALQKGLVEYLRAQAEGVEIREPHAFVVQAAFRRAIDELRREARRADGTVLEKVFESGHRASAAAEEVALDNIEAGHLQEAIDSLPAEERQVLALHYFAEVGQRRAAELLHMSERTFRRRLRRSLSDLAQLLGAPAPEPGSHRGLETGVAAWAGLGGGRVVASPGVADHLSAFLESVQTLPGRILDRLRGPGTRLAASEAPERIGAIAGGPAGKMIGGCAGAAVVCALSGVVGPGLDLGGPSTPQEPHAHQSVRPTHSHPSARPALIEPRSPLVSRRGGEHSPSRSGFSGAGSPTPRHNTRSRRQKSTRKKQLPATEAEQAEEQFSGVARAAGEAEAPRSDSTSESASTEDAAPAQSPPEPESSHGPSEERQVEEQFRGALAR
jgi:RNA polymerase sigma factor (sigma-70 family)